MIELTLLKTMLMLLAIPGETAPAATVTKAPSSEAPTSIAAIIIVDGKISRSDIPQTIRWSCSTARISERREIDLMVTWFVSDFRMVLDT